MTELELRYRAVLERVSRAMAAPGAAPIVTVVAVSKSFSVETIARAVDAGVTDLGENRAQELRRKSAVLGTGPRWHFVGHLQTNKVKDVVGVADLIHSVDRPELAVAIDRAARAMGFRQRALIQVNVSGEASKHGAEPRAVPALAHAMEDLDGVSLEGLMTIPPLPEDPEDSRPVYARLAALRDRLVKTFPDASGLSMGMTRDFEVAIEEGATHVRIGEAIFGPRPPR